MIFGRVYPYAVLGLLTLAYTVGYIDRQVLNLLVEPIKSDLGLSDVRISLLQGLGFSVGYLLLTPVFGRWVDVAPRRNILAGATAAWSLLTALAGVARNFQLLLTIRFGLGSTEAALTPASWSIISDVFDDRKLARAFSLFLAAPYFGGGLALLSGGWILQAAKTWDVSAIPLLNHAAPWQMVFMVVSLPGFAIAALLLLIHEPRRGALMGGTGATLSLKEVISIMRRKARFYLNFFLGMAFIIIPLYAFPAWFPAYLMRKFSMPISAVGSHWGLITLASGSVGMLLGPVFGNWLRRGDNHNPLQLPILCAIALVMCCAAMYLAPTAQLAMLAAGAGVFFNSAPLAVAASALQLASPPGMRGVTAAVYAVIVLITGLAIAPTLVALLTDFVFRDESRVGDSLALVCGSTSAAGAILMAYSLAPYREAVAELEAGRAAPRPGQSIAASESV